MSTVDSDRLRIIWVNWRDTRHPQGGGSERYVERIAAGLAARAHRVTVVCAEHDRAAKGDWVDGVKFQRRGGRLTVYWHALLTVRRTRADVIVDVQNGLPFFSRLVARCPVIVLVHHVHREQWRILFDPLRAAVGWWMERRLARWLYHNCRYVTVSESTRAELAVLGVRPARVTVVPNGLDPVPVARVAPAPQPVLVAVSRLVPHKQLDHAIEVVARLRDRIPTLRLEIIGQGPSLADLREYAHRRGVADRVVLHGWLDEVGKHDVLDRSWIHLCPSAKEGWGLSIVEAAAHGVPTVAYTSAGGVCESVRDGRTGLLAADLDQFVAHVDRLLREPELRCAMAEQCRVHAARFTWQHGVDQFEALARSVRAQ